MENVLLGFKVKPCEITTVLLESVHCGMKQNNNKIKDPMKY